MNKAELVVAMLATHDGHDPAISPQVVVETAAGHMLSIKGVRQLGNGIIALRVIWGDEPR